MKDLESVDDVRLVMDSDVRKAVELAAHEIAVEIQRRYRNVAEGCLPLDETAIALRFYRHIRAALVARREQA